MLHLTVRGEGCDGGARIARRRLANSRCAVATDGAFAPSAQEASARVPQSACAGSRGDGRDPLRCAHRVPLGRVEGDRDLSPFVGASPLSGVDEGGRLRRILETRVAELRPPARHRLAVVGDGRSHDEGSARRGKKPAQTPRIGPNEAPSAVCLPTVAASQSGSPWTVRNGMTASCSRRPWRASQSAGRAPSPITRRVCAWTRGTTIPSSAASRASSVSRFICGHEARKRVSFVADSFVAPVAGWLRGRTAG